MEASLIPHPATTGGPVRSIAVHVARVAPSELTLRYRLVGDVGGIALPGHAAPARTDGLWQHTCFEAFVRPRDAASYCEFNLSPSSQWAAYGFSSYREGMTPLDLTAPSIRVKPGSDEILLQALLDLSGVPTLSGNGDWQLALSAVIEDAGGARSYWALAHPAGKPDFHHRDCFVLELPPANQA